MGKQEYRYSDRVRFGDLPSTERKSINKVLSRTASAFDHTHVCNGEIGAMLGCFEAHAWDTAPCLPQIEAMYGCVEQHKHDPDPKVLVRKWQGQLKRNVLAHFSAKKIR
jgi:fructose-1,6-bisphosphatase/inositol monophosphatase family enzyme